MVLPIQTDDVQVQPALYEGATRAPSPPVIAELWSLCDIVCCELNARLHTAGATPIVTIRQSHNARRYSMASPDGERFIAIVSLLPTARGGVSCGAYIGTSESRTCAYVEPAVEGDRPVWRMPGKAALLGADDLVDLFSRVFGALCSTPPARKAGQPKPR